MPRPLRVEFPDALYHVTARGVLKQAIVLDDHDRRRWMEYLKEAVLRFGLELYAFVLMDNHYHLFVSTPQANLGKAMQYLNGSWAMYFNVRHDRNGHLFERRYRGILIEEQGHYTEISRYVHLNPVRAGIVERPEDYVWSSYGGYHWGRMPLSWMDYGRVLSEFGEGKEARRRYREFVFDGLGRRLSSPWKDAHEGWVLGSRKFIAKVYGMLAKGCKDGRWQARAALRGNLLDATLDDIAAAVCAHFDLAKEMLKKGGPNTRKARGIFMLIAGDKAGIPVQETERYIGLNSKNSIQKAIRRNRASARTNKELRKRIADIEARIRKLSPKGV